MCIVIMPGVTRFKEIMAKSNSNTGVLFFFSFFSEIINDMYKSTRGFTSLHLNSRPLSHLTNYHTFS